MSNADIIAHHEIPLAFEPDAPMRIGTYLIGKFEALPSRKSIKRSIKLGAILLNDIPASTSSWVKKGDVIKLRNLFQKPKVIYQLSIEIIYEDEYLAIINKPAGIPVSGNTFRTVYNSLGHFLSIDYHQNFYPQPAHRLDSATSGLLIIAKNANTRIQLGQLFENKAITKTYQAIVHGHTGKGGLINFPIDGKAASSKFECIAWHHTQNELKFSHIILQPLTGRTHQLRKHCLAMGHPILGDKSYQRQGWQLRRKGMLLCSTGLSFKHPETEKEMNFNIDPPAKFAKIMRK